MVRHVGMSGPSSIGTYRRTKTSVCRVRTVYTCIEGQKRRYVGSGQ